MTGPAHQTLPDPRVDRTRRALRQAFNAILLSEGYGAASAAAVAARAGVGRSTFYEHYEGKEALLSEVLIPILGPLADAGAGIDNPSLPGMIAHVWENRAMGRAVFSGRARQVMTGRLKAMIIERLTARRRTGPAPIPMAAAQAAAGQMGLLEEWASGRHGATVQQVVDQLRATAVR